MASRFYTVVVDSQDPAALARFWAAVLDYQDAEVDRICSLGATKIDICQSSEATWVVMADPEGNEFCVLRAREGGV